MKVALAYRRTGSETLLGTRGMEAGDKEEASHDQADETDDEGSDPPIFRSRGVGNGVIRVTHSVVVVTTPRRLLWETIQARPQDPVPPLTHMVTGGPVVSFPRHCDCHPLGRGGVIGCLTMARGAMMFRPGRNLRGCRHLRRCRDICGPGPQTMFGTATAKGLDQCPTSPYGPKTKETQNQSGCHPSREEAEVSQSPTFTAPAFLNCRCRGAQATPGREARLGKSLQAHVLRKVCDGVVGIPVRVIVATNFDPRRGTYAAVFSPSLLPPLLLDLLTSCGIGCPLDRHPCGFRRQHVPELPQRRPSSLPQTLVDSDYCWFVRIPSPATFFCSAGCCLLLQMRPVLRCSSPWLLLPSGHPYSGPILDSLGHPGGGEARHLERCHDRVPLFELPYIVPYLVGTFWLHFQSLLFCLDPFDFRFNPDLHGFCRLLSLAGEPLQRFHELGFILPRPLRFLDGLFQSPPGLQVGLSDGLQEKELARAKLYLACPALVLLGQLWLWFDTQSGWSFLFGVTRHRGSLSRLAWLAGAPSPVRLILDSDGLALQGAFLNGQPTGLQTLVNKWHDGRRSLSHLVQEIIWGGRRLFLSGPYRGSRAVRA